MLRIGNILPQDLPQIIALQRANLRENISKDIQQSQGFLVARYDMPFMERLYAAAPPVVAYDGGRVVGYCLPTPLEVAATSEFLQSTSDMVAGLIYRGKPIKAYRYCLMGQICVAEGYRGAGLFKRLYLAMREQLQGLYDLVITEVSYRNERSMRAHQRLGWEVIHDYQLDEHWAVVVWDLRK
jgi:GNAT superfamily N-acetyltransferase